MKKWMKKMAIIGAVLFVGGIGVTSIGAAIGGAAAGLDFLIDQEGFEQGYRPPHLLYNMIRKGEKIEKEYAYTDISIKTKYNL